MRFISEGTSAEEVRDIKDLSWTPFNGDGSEDTTVAPAESNNQFKEYKYSASALPDFTAFQIKNCYERYKLSTCTKN